MAATLAGGKAKPLGEARWAEMHSQAWEVVNRLEDENADLRAELAKLMAAFLVYMTHGRGQ
jgi:hypothetical protein